LKPGDGITIFTPDDTVRFFFLKKERSESEIKIQKSTQKKKKHFDIALYAIQRGIHVLLTKPAVKTVRDHKILIEEAKKLNFFPFSFSFFFFF